MICICINNITVSESRPNKFLGFIIDDQVFKPIVVITSWMLNVNFAILTLLFTIHTKASYYRAQNPKIAFPSPSTSLARIFSLYRKLFCRYKTELFVCTFQAVKKQSPLQQRTYLNVKVINRSYCIAKSCISCK